jgi:hypothetical protein
MKFYNIKISLDLIIVKTGQRIDLIKKGKSQTLQKWFLTTLIDFKSEDISTKLG